MKKHLIAAAVLAAVSAPSMAQQVTISGLLDVGLYSVSDFTAGPTAAVNGNQTKTSRTAQLSGWSSSILRFNATEDLGGGLKAGATISSFMDNTIGQREKFITLSGDFGSVNLGRFVPSINGYGAYAFTGTNNTAGTSDTTGFDFIAGSLSGTPTRAVTTGLFTAGATGAGGTFEIQDNIIEYTTPTMNGFNLALGLVKNTSDADGTASLNKTTQEQQTIRLNFVQGPLSASVAHGKRNVQTEAATTLATESDGTLTWFGASYNFGPALVTFAHGSREDSTGITPAAVARTADVSVNNIGIRIPLGALTIGFSAYTGSDERTTAANDERDLSGHQVHASYALSKRTTAYLASGQNRNKAQTGANANDAKLTGTNMGIVHTF
jgi:predicted porin